MLHFDNFKTISFAPFSSSSSSSSSALPPSLRRLISPTTSVHFLPGEFKRFVDESSSSKSLEELRLGYARGIPAEEMESLVRLRRLKIGFIQFDAVDVAAKLAASMDLNRIENQKVESINNKKI